MLCIADKPVKGLLSDYLAKPGEQYYKDLGGNLKKVCGVFFFLGSKLVSSMTVTLSVLLVQVVDSNGFMFISVLRQITLSLHKLDNLP